MAGTITHKWDGTTLIITSDSGTSACDLKGETGSTGVRGAQGRPGILTDSTGVLLAEADDYYTKEEVDEAIKYVDGGISAAVQELATSNEKRITNLEKRLNDDYFVTDDSTAYTREVPGEVAPYAEISKIGGMTYLKSPDAGNLFPYPYQRNSWDTWTEENGVWTQYSDMDEGDYWMLLTEEVTFPAGTYIMEFGNINASDILLYEWNDNVTVNMISYGKFRVVATGDWKFSGVSIYIVAYDTMTCYPMLYPEDSPITWQPRGGVEGFQSTKPTAIESKGENGVIDTFTIPKEVQALPGYGEGVSAEYCNHIRFTNEGVEFVKWTHKIVLDGTEDWQTYYTSRGGIDCHYITGIPMARTTLYSKRGDEYKQAYGMASPLGFNDKSEYSVSDQVSVFNGELEAITYTEKGDALEVDEFKAYLAEQYANGTPLTVVYELAEPVIRDITDKISTDNYIEVEGGGAILIKNEYNNNAPGTFTYLLKEVGV